MVSRHSHFKLSSLTATQLGPSSMPRLSAAKAEAGTDVTYPPVLSNLFFGCLCLVHFGTKPLVVAIDCPHAPKRCARI